MLLKHESITIIHLYETGMLDESEYIVKEDNNLLVNRLDVGIIEY